MLKTSIDRCIYLYIYIYYYFYIWIVNIHNTYIYIQQFIQEYFHSFQDLCTE